jgi:hypothetical protein
MKKLIFILVIFLSGCIKYDEPKPLYFPENVVVGEKPASYSVIESDTVNLVPKTLSHESGWVVINKRISDSGTYHIKANLNVSNTGNGFSVYIERNGTTVASSEVYSTNSDKTYQNFNGTRTIEIWGITLNDGDQISLNGSAFTQLNISGDIIFERY